MELFERLELEMKEAGYDLDKIPAEVHSEHIWSDGLLLWWSKHRSLPDANELASDMFDEWDDPVSDAEAQAVLDYLTS